jgi:hypothetical protein
MNVVEIGSMLSQNDVVMVLQPDMVEDYSDDGLCVLRF